MAELAKKLHLKKDGVEQTGKAYSTTAEAGAEYIPNKIDDVTCYVAIGNTTDNRATVGRVKKSNTAAERAILSTGKPPYTEQSWTKAGAYTWTAPLNIDTARIALCGGGGGGVANNYVFGGNYTGGTGGTSRFGNLLSATGGKGGSVTAKPYSDSDGSLWYNCSAGVGTGGSPNGRNGGISSDNASGGTGFALQFTLANGNYGAGGSANTGKFSGAASGGGSGGYNKGDVAVTPGATYEVIVGTGNGGNSGFVLIAFGGDI